MELRRPPAPKARAILKWKQGRSSGGLQRPGLLSEKESDAVEAAVEKVLAAGLRTADLARKGEKFVTCREMGEAVAKEIR